MVEYKITKMDSAYEEMRKQYASETSKFSTIQTKTGGKNLTEDIKRTVAKDIGGHEIDINDTYSGDIFNISAAFTGKFTAWSKMLRIIRKNVNDISPLLSAISADFFGTNKEEVFSQNSAGDKPFYKLPDATTRYGKMKIKRVGSVVPGLVFTGGLKASLTNPEDEFAINKITKRSLRIGTRVLNYEDKPLVPLLIKADTQNNVSPVRNPVIVGTRWNRWMKATSMYMTKMSAKDFQNA